MELKEKRKQAGFTQMELAKAAKVSYASISRYENGTRKPRVDQAKRIAEVLNFDWTLFFK